jgi:purine-nucleoside phosphorylase
MSLLKRDTKTFLQEEGLGNAELCLILGSGLNPLAGDLGLERTLPYSEIPDFPSTTVEGHAGNLHLGRAQGLSVAVFEGRFHYYEGLSMYDVVYPVRLARSLGARTLVVTNASGGVNPELKPGDFMLVRDQINLMGSNPLIGMEGFRGMARFPEMSDPYSATLRGAAKAVFTAAGVACFEGVLAGLPGPCYETPAEVRMLQKIGVDAVCMSSIPEVIMAKALGMDVLGITLISNRAAGLQEFPLNHADVIRVAKERLTVFSNVVRGILMRLGDPQDGKNL